MIECDPKMSEINLTGCKPQNKTKKEKKKVMSSLCNIFSHTSESGSTSNPTRCPAGTFSNATGNAVAGDCTDCTQGQYCETTGLTEPTGPCDAGVYYYNIIIIINIIYLDFCLNIYTGC